MKTLELTKHGILERVFIHLTKTLNTKNHRLLHNSIINSMQDCQDILNKKKFEITIEVLADTKQCSVNKVLKEIQVPCFDCREWKKGVFLFDCTMSFNSKENLIDFFKTKKGIDLFHFE